MHMAVLPASGKADRLMYAAHNSLINLDADVHRDLRLQQSEFFFPNTWRLSKNVLVRKLMTY